MASQALARGISPFGHGEANRLDQGIHPGMSVLTVVSPGAQGSFRPHRQAGDHPSTARASAGRDGGGHRLQSRRLGRQPMDGLRRLSKAPALHVEGGAVRFTAGKMDLASWRFHSDRSHEPFAKFDQDRSRYFAERRNHSDLPDGHAKGGECCCLQARRCDRRAPRQGSTCARFL